MKFSFSLQNFNRILCFSGIFLEILWAILCFYCAAWPLFIISVLKLLFLSWMAFTMFDKKTKKSLYAQQVSCYLLFLMAQCIIINLSIIAIFFGMWALGLLMWSNELEYNENFVSRDK
jgi:hypothetical protein